MNRDQIVTLLLLLVLPFFSVTAVAQSKGKYDAIYSGTPWFDQNGKIVSAHGANIIKDGGRYYFFGEAHSDTSNAFVGFNCYSSNDLYNWKFESVALPLQASGKLGPNRVGERVKAMKCPKTGEYLLFMHVDTLGYKDQFVGYATSKNIVGPYTFHGPLLFKGKPIKKWDMGVYQDEDGTGYILTHGGQIHRLSDDYKSAVELTNDAMTSGFESPTMFKKNGTYFFLGSNLTSWERNDNYYFTSTSLKGPWTSKGLFVPTGSLTWNSQVTYVLPIVGTKDTTFLFMGDRWSYPKQASAATYVWQPIAVSGSTFSIPTYQEAWQINTITGVASPQKKRQKVIANTDKNVKYLGKWETDKITSEHKSAADQASVALTFTGKQITLHSWVGTTKGYAHVKLADKKGKILYAGTIDLYRKTPLSTPVFVSPILNKDTYTLSVSTTGTRSNWSDKRKTDYGSTGYEISIDKFVIVE